jgi:hypothetical protein
LSFATKIQAGFVGKPLGCTRVTEWFLGFAIETWHLNNNMASKKVWHGVSGAWWGVVLQGWTAGERLQVGGREHPLLAATVTPKPPAITHLTARDHQSRDNLPVRSWPSFTGSSAWQQLPSLLWSFTWLLRII